MLKVLFVIIIAVLNRYRCFGNPDTHYASMPELFHLDDYDQCMQLGNEALYCSFRFELQPKVEENASITWEIIQNVSSDPRNYRHDHLRHGVCISTFCSFALEDLSNLTTKELIETCYNEKFEPLGLKGNVTSLRCQTNASKYVIDIYDIIFGVLFLSYFLVVILASIYEGTARYQKQDIYERLVNTKAGRIIAAFSIPRNWQRLRSSNESPDAAKLKSIQGIRFYNLICVILSHTIMVTFAGPVSNPQYTEQMTGKTLNMFLANGNYAVQTFFLISGWLLSFHFFDMMENRQTFNIKYIFAALINRYIRLTPVLAAMIAFESTWLVHLGGGPNWDDLVGEEYRNCRENWWTNLLYINNYVNKNNMCLHQTWYIASDTQLYALSLIVLTIVWKYEKKVIHILGTVIIIGLAIPGCVAFFKNYDIIIRQYPETLYKLRGLKVPAWHDLYSSAYSNITGYTIGLTFGYIFYKNRNSAIAVTKVHVILWWFLSFGICDFIILIAARMYDPNYKSTLLESALYWAFGKNIFALGIAIGIYGFSNKIGSTLSNILSKGFTYHGTKTKKAFKHTVVLCSLFIGFARWICEWEAVSVIGRLTYSTYIVHTGVVRIRGGLIRSPIFINDYLLLMTTLSDVVLSYLVGTLVCLVFEMPVSALQKLMVPKMDTKYYKGTSEKSLKTLDMDEKDIGNSK